MSSSAKQQQPAIKQLSSTQEHHKRTVARLSKIQSHLATAPRTGKLKGKVAIITGVALSKASAAALLFAHEGAQHIYLIDFSGENLPNLKSTIEEQYPDVKATVIQADAADDQAISGVCQQALREEGRLDVFFANAEETPGEVFTNTMRVNALSSYLAVKYASAAMKQTNEVRGKPLSGGSIILTASIAGIRSGAGSVDSAVNSIAQTAAWQLQRTDIRVNAICPGLIETGMTILTFNYARQRGTAEKLGQLNPLGRYGVAEEIANVALFLASDDSSYVNGQAFAVDGGLTASVPVVPGKFA
ncbi:sex determination protein tasselseed-2 [Multifurca ochricompacta]|uniref:Sex determination protein tasselseed-2 n=1 Tax=Multifurca ochricompacta TaxID=376703 RepID=A0AAD4M925_9AGAM|nr:sex determination protein tasselseed-2 [Multifurca ochricompacta]